MRTVLGLLRHVVEFEIGIWASLYRWIFRRPRVPHRRAEAFSYVGAKTAILWAFIGVSAIDIPTAHLLLPWETGRRVMLVLGIWGLLWMVGLLAALKTYPHVIDDQFLRIRYGFRHDIQIPWSAVEAVRNRRRDLPSSRTIHRTAIDDGLMLQVGMNGQTNIDVDLVGPLTVRLPSGTETISAIRCYADEPAVMVASAKARLTTNANS